MIRRTLPLSKPAARAAATAASDASSKGGQLSDTFGGVLARVKGTVMEAMARGIPEQERAFLAQRWGFASSNNSSPGLEQNTVPKFAAADDAAARGVMEDMQADIAKAARTRTVLSEEEETRAQARAAGAAARKAIEAGSRVTRVGGVLHTNGGSSSNMVEATPAADPRAQNGSGVGVGEAHEAIHHSGAVPLAYHERQQAAQQPAEFSQEQPAGTVINEVSRQEIQNTAGEQEAHARRPEEEVVMHPILGELVADLEYKRVYRTSIASLIKVPVWEKQRILRPERALAIAEAKLKKKKFNGIPGVITLFERGGPQGEAEKSSERVELRPNERRDLEEAAEAQNDSIPISARTSASRELGIVDGQHRVGALMLMADRGGWDSEAQNIIVDVFSTHTDKDVADLFTEINRAEPVRLVDMPGEGAPLPVIKVINTVVDLLKEDFPEMFKTSMRCRPPHVNIDNLRDEIFSSGLCERHGLRTADDLHEWLMKVNRMLARRGDDHWAEVAKGYKGMSAEATTKALIKAKNKMFFLGMDKSWQHV